MMLVSEDGKPRRLNYYTVIGCEHWNGRKYNSLPADWKIEVIRLCSKQKSIHLHEAERLAAKYRIAALDPIINHPTRKPKTQRRSSMSICHQIIRISQRIPCANEGVKARLTAMSDQKVPAQTKG